MYVNIDKYHEKAREILKTAGLNGVIDINLSRRGSNGNGQHVYIEPFPYIGNKSIIDKLNNIKGFYGRRMLGYDNRYQYQGYLEIEEVSNE